MSKTAKVLKVPRSHADLKASLIEQIGLLQTACSLYDQGNKDAAKFIAVSLRVLLHDTQQSHSLLKQIGLREKKFSEWNFSGQRRKAAAKGKAPNNQWTVQFSGPLSDQQSTPPPILEGVATASCRLLIQFVGPTGGEFVVPLSSLGSEIRKRFGNWWTDEVVRDVHDRTFSRRELVLNIANTVGGAHIDPGLEQGYLDFSRKNSLGWNFSTNGHDWQAIPAPHLACMRQIAHEVLMTLQRTAPQGFVRPYEFTDPTAGKDGFAIAGMRFPIA